LSTRLPAIKEKLARIKSLLAAMKGNEVTSLQIRIAKVTNIVTENESTIWLRTRIGEPMLKDLHDALDDAIKALEGEGSAIKSFEEKLKEVEIKAYKIDEESRRRSMVVT
jgi:hypothetical protein